MSSNFSGTVTADNLAIRAGGTLTVDSTVVSLAELGVLDGVTAGTATASKALVLGASKEIATITSATITTLTSTTVGATTGNITTVAATTVGATTGNITTVNATTANVTDVVMGAGGSINLDSNTATLVSHAATLTKRHVQVTSEALTTAAGSSQAFVLTLTGVAATDIVLVSACGGTNTREHIAYKAVATTDTVTVTVSNIGPTDALNGTVIFNVLIMKA